MWPQSVLSVLQRVLLQRILDNPKTAAPKESADNSEGDFETARSFSRASPVSETFGVQMITRKTRYELVVSNNPTSAKESRIPGVGAAVPPFGPKIPTQVGQGGISEPVTCLYQKMPFMYVNGNRQGRRGSEEDRSRTSGYRWVQTNKER